ncbi:MAG: HAMP domain-containing histidine kinase [Actinomycetota bacterium]|nr:HAMP domain-containing histidine kinase [Actinomycetota bacterium]
MNAEPRFDASGVAPPPPARWPSDLEPVDPEPVDPNFWAPPPPRPPHFGSLDELPEPQAPRRRRYGPRSLTGRLVAFVVTLVAVLVLATGIGTYYALSSFLLNRLDQQVQVAASQPVVQMLRDASLSASPLTIWITQLGPNGEVLDHVANGPGPASQVRHMSLTSSTRLRLAAVNLKPTTITTTDGHQLRVISEPQPQLAGVVVIGLGTDDVHRTLHRLLVLELSIGGAAIALAFVATSWGVQFSLRRLRRVTATAQEVAAELSPDGAGLDRRVEVTEPDTEVGQLADSMNTLLAAVETQFAARLANEQQMRQFLADASHELRTPLTSIRGYAELSRMQRAQGQLTDPAENLARIESEGTRMSRLVDDLLTLARTDQGSAPRNEWIDVAELLEEAVGGARAAHPTRRIDLTVPPALNIIGDRDQLLRVVRNLVTNAAIHTREDGQIVVAATRESGSLVVRISDAGPGLPPEEAAHVFERFWRADKARTRARGGSGLGLAIVASIVQAHGGTVRFDSTVEGGSTVTVYLPLGTG